VAAGRVLCVIPAYNESPESVYACVRAVLAQTVPVDIVVVDDGSALPVRSVPHPRVHWLRQENTGKRGAQTAVLRRYPPGAYAFVLTVDSDSAPRPDALEHLLRAMADPRVQAATGMLEVRNYRDSVVAWAADLDIGMSCVLRRTAGSVLGSLETTSGALALYRADLLYDHLDEYGVDCPTGDDRWLTLRALRRGQVVGVAEAVVETDMPATLRATYGQRLRWARSWWWALPYVFANLAVHQLLIPAYGLVQSVLAPLVTGWAVLGAVAAAGGHGDLPLWTIGGYALAYTTVQYGLSALYLLGRRGMPTRDKWTSWLVGTAAAMLLNVCWIVPIRYVALFRLRDNRWHNREAAGRAGRRRAARRRVVRPGGRLPDNPGRWLPTATLDPRETPT